MPVHAYTQSGHTDPINSVMLIGMPYRLALVLSHYIVITLINLRLLFLVLYRDWTNSSSVVRRVTDGGPRWIISAGRAHSRIRGSIPSRQDILKSKLTSCLSETLVHLSRRGFFHPLPCRLCAEDCPWFLGRQNVCLAFNANTHCASNTLLTFYYISYL